MPVSIQISWISRFISSRVKASSAPNGSSISSTDGSTARLRTIEARCCMPPESSRGNLFSKPLRLTRSSNCSMRSMSGLRRLQFEGKRDVLEQIAPGQEIGVLEDHRDFGVRLGDDVVARAGSRPLVRSCSPAIDHSSVVLPQPDGPRMQRNSPSRTSSEPCSSACTDPSGSRRIWSRRSTTILGCCRDALYLQGPLPARRLIRRTEAVLPAAAELSRRARAPGRADPLFENMLHKSRPRKRKNFRRRRRYLPGACPGIAAVSRRCAAQNSSALT